MAPNQRYMGGNGQEPEPVSRTYQYRKVMKPMLERKRRARINRCLDELKEIMMVALQTEGEHVAKLEKADILELTVRHLQKLRHQNQLTVRPEQTYIDRFRAGFKHCATEVTQFIGNVDQNTSAHLVKHLNSCIRRLDGMQPLKEVTPMQGRPKSQLQQQIPVTSPPPPATNLAYHHHPQQVVHQIPNNQNQQMMEYYQKQILSQQTHSQLITKQELVDGDTSVWRPW